MSQGVTSSGIIHANSAEAGSVETEFLAVDSSVQESPEDLVTKRESFTCSESLNTSRRRECAYLTLRRLTVKILQDQHTASRIDEGEIETVVMEKITPEKAKALVASDGHWNPDQTADRIFSFAMTISGNDRKKFDKIKESITGGFQSAGESFGGKLPELSEKTLAATLERLNEWAENGGAPGRL